MSRYFLEVAYMGTRYSGFQVQENANTVQAEVEKAFSTIQRSPVELTGSSRTDTGVHALQNYFHVDFDGDLLPDFLYKMNAVLPADIVVKRVVPVAPEAHCRFDALSREYNYYISRQKDPFRNDRAYYYPYKLNIDIMQEAAGIITGYTDFTSFSKRNTQVKTFTCRIMHSSWREEGEVLVYRVQANRFLRGMVRALVATMLQVGRNKMTLPEFRAVIEAKDCTKASFAAPGHGLFLSRVVFSYL